MKNYRVAEMWGMVLLKAKVLFYAFLYSNHENRHACLMALSNVPSIGEIGEFDMISGKATCQRESGGRDWL
jgi:hypothetical protein